MTICLSLGEGIRSLQCMTQRCRTRRFAFRDRAASSLPEAGNSRSGCNHGLVDAPIPTQRAGMHPGLFPVHHAAGAPPMADGSVCITGAASTAYAPSLNAQALATLTALHRAGHSRLSVLGGNGSSEEWDQSPFERCGRQLMARRKLLARSYSVARPGNHLRTSTHVDPGFAAARPSQAVGPRQCDHDHSPRTVRTRHESHRNQSAATRNRLTVAGAQGGERCARRSERSSQPGAG